ncbi:MAG: hypothetical protein U0R66_14905 [Mycobacterium sp.]
MPGRGAVAGLLASAGLGLAVVTGGVGAAAADPVLPVDPAIPLPAPGDPAAPPPADAPPADLAAAPADPAAVPNAAAEPPSLLGQFAQVAQSNPLATMKDLIGAVPQPTMMLGATPLPPEVDTTYLKPGQDPLSLASQLKPQNFRMPSPDQASPYALSPNDNPSPFARVNAFKGVHAITHSSLGRMPGSELGQPLPGTAPPPGTNIPAGLEQFYVDPAAAPPPGAASVPTPGAPPTDPAAPATSVPGPPAPVDPLLFGSGAG